jgi:hypothetical protein
MPLPRRVTTALLATLVLPAAVPAQVWVVDASAGRFAYEAATSAPQLTGAAFTVRRDAPSWLYAAAGVPFDSAGAAWAAGGGGTRLALRLGALQAGIDASAQGFAYRGQASAGAGGGGTAQTMPMLALARGPAVAEVRSGLLHYGASYGDSAVSRTLHASDARVTVAAGGLRLSAEARYWRAEEDAYPYAGASLELPLGPGVLWAYGGSWMSDAVQSPVWGAGARVRVLRATELYAAVRQDTNDPLYWNAPRRGWSVGLSRRLGRPPVFSAPAAAPRVERGRATFRVPVSTTAAPAAVGGDFNRWSPVVMRRQGEWWTITLPLAPGVYRYGFRRADGTWFVPDGAPGRRDDGFGGVSAVLVVP